MRKFVYLTSFRKLVISEPIRGHLELIPGVNITNDIDVKWQYLTTEFAEAAGAIEMNHFDRASNLVFGEFSDRRFGESPPEGVLRGVLLWINDLFKNAWLLKDHAMECDAAFLRDDNERSPAWFSNFLAISPSFADGAVWRETEMSISDLKAWGSKSDEIEEYLHPSNLAASGFMMAKEYSRLGRALHFVSSARTAPNIALKSRITVAR